MSSIYPLAELQNCPILQQISRITWVDTVVGVFETPWHRLHMRDCGCFSGMNILQDQPSWDQPPIVKTTVKPRVPHLTRGYVEIGLLSPCLCLRYAFTLFWQNKRQHCTFRKPRLVHWRKRRKPEATSSVRTLCLVEAIASRLETIATRGWRPCCYYPSPPRASNKCFVLSAWVGSCDVCVAMWWDSQTTGNFIWLVWGINSLAKSESSQV